MSDQPQNTQMVKAAGGSLVPTMGVAAIIERRQLVREALNKAMVVDHHYGVIPGTDKAALYKPGAEMLLSMFGVAVEPRVEEKALPGDNAEYTVYCSGRNTHTGDIIGTGIGSASTLETKYAWKKAYPEDYDAAPEQDRRKSQRKGKGGSSYTAYQIRVNPADVKNTVLKMAKKRAMIDFVLTAFSASDIFMPEPDDEDLNRMAAEREERERSGSAKSMVEPASVPSSTKGKKESGPPPTQTVTALWEGHEEGGSLAGTPGFLLKFSDLESGVQPVFVFVPKNSRDYVAKQPFGTKFTMELEEFEGTLTVKKWVKVEVPKDEAKPAAPAGEKATLEKVEVKE